MCAHYFTPLTNWNGFYQIRFQDGQLIDEEPLKGTKYRMPFGNRWNRSYLPTSIIRLGSIGEGRIDHCEEVETCFFLGESGGFVSLSYLGNRVEVPVVDVFEEYQKMMVLRRRSHPCYTIVDAPVFPISDPKE
ncbi:uncharacterized protein LOC106347744 isoform X1 [Brassica napus]|uniref:uncharacterized protein LOC106296650 isoform X1 n=1 Tax=Brassica oleracea var. oleracea TaxID=109376 RepID=UPI0006A6FCA3|nr:PREDICTED: uncharacterized protein LOC106296650 isoform X1 [Brassica oleracea var. oleracea]XP_013588285.1 PREDICTED: uncharacterized protein LOC106296650 isoform X1 [Brassica oleracea var. oleracea]XP_013588286.1 PREDICTED: uncharacterized protein LOC106296650 isoform X1 [Brassica oleracea var. oleracea]XP_013642789.1 uncharacterized protein LOC106347744 isoform X1 [Brassica napus]XP_022559874.1 uncharacterized protein LOC106347744 isoform X1 [Brassica napus]XP_022559875.1 uncharacterized 